MWPQKQEGKIMCTIPTTNIDFDPSLIQHPTERCPFLREVHGRKGNWALETEKAQN